MLPAHWTRKQSIFLKVGHYAGIDIFRLDERGKTVEHRDVLQVIPEKSSRVLRRAHVV